MCRGSARLRACSSPETWTDRASVTRGPPGRGKQGRAQEVPVGGQARAVRLGSLHLAASMAPLTPHGWAGGEATPDLGQGPVRSPVLWLPAGKPGAGLRQGEQSCWGGALFSAPGAEPCLSPQVDRPQPWPRPSLCRRPRLLRGGRPARHAEPQASSEGPAAHPALSPASRAAPAYSKCSIITYCRCQMTWCPHALGERQRQSLSQAGLSQSAALVLALASCQAPSPPWSSALGTSSLVLQAAVPEASRAGCGFVLTQPGVFSPPRRQWLAHF